MKVANLPTVRNAPDIVDRPVVPRLHFFRVFHDLVDEVAEVQDEAEPVLGRGPLVLEDHAPIGVELAFVDVLAADECEVDRAPVVGTRRSDGAADAATVPFVIGEPIPIFPRWLEPADEYPRSPVGGG